MKKYYWSTVLVILVLVTVVYNFTVAKKQNPPVLMIEAPKLEKKEYMICQGKNRHIDGKTCSWCEIENTNDMLACFMEMEKPK